MFFCAISVYSHGDVIGYGANACVRLCKCLTQVHGWTVLQNSTSKVMIGNVSYFVRDSAN